jgi:hypothetical protein
MIEIIEGVKLSEMCDYSFGDQASVICGIPGGWMKRAHISNNEFISTIDNIYKSRNYMTLFIDNIRLYKRVMKLKKESDQQWVDNLMNENDLLDLCSKFPKMNFIIFTNLEDTSIDEQIEDKIPNNVLSINAVNSVFHNDKVKPFPYGMQRSMHYGDDRKSIILSKINNENNANKLLYVNHTIVTNIEERSGINELFIDKSWATVDNSRTDYGTFLSKIKSHKFMICPIGNAVDCHRNWEVLYMKRVPIMKRNEYLEFLFKDYPVLFVDSYGDINEDILINNEHLYQEALNIDLNKLDLNYLFNKTLNKYLK